MWLFELWAALRFLSSCCAFGRKRQFADEVFVILKLACSYMEGWQGDATNGDGLSHLTFVVNTLVHLWYLSSFVVLWVNKGLCSGETDKLSPWLTSSSEVYLIDPRCAVLHFVCTCLHESVFCITCFFSGPPIMRESFCFSAVNSYIGSSVLTGYNFSKSPPPTRKVKWSTP